MNNRVWGSLSELRRHKNCANLILDRTFTVLFSNTYTYFGGNHKSPFLVSFHISTAALATVWFISIKSAQPNDLRCIWETGCYACEVFLSSRKPPVVIGAYQCSCCGLEVSRQWTLHSGWTSCACVWFVQYNGFFGWFFFSFFFFCSEGAGRRWKQRHRWLGREGPVMGLFARRNQWLITFEAGSSWHGESESQRKHMTLLGGLALIEFTQLLPPSCSRDLANEKWHLLGECGWFLALVCKELQTSSIDVDMLKYGSVAEQGSIGCCRRLIWSHFFWFWVITTWPPSLARVSIWFKALHWLGLYL